MKINLKKLYTNGFEYGENSWKAQKTKHLNALGLPNAKDTYFVTMEIAKDILKIVKGIKTKTTICESIVIENYLGEEVATEKKATTKTVKKELKTKEEVASQKVIADKRLVDRLSILLAENTDLLIYVRMLEDILQELQAKIEPTSHNEKRVLEVIEAIKERRSKIITEFNEEE